MIKNALLIIVSVLISVLIVEAALRFIYTPPALSARMKIVAAGNVGGDSTLSWDAEKMAHQPLQTATISHAEYNHTASTDKFGFRNPCLQEPIEGILVGDSSVFGIGVEDEETFQCWNAKHGKNTYSIGVSGAAPRHYLRWVDKHVASLRKSLSFKDDFYVQYFLSPGNDFAELATYKNPKAGRSKGPSQTESKRNSVFEPINKFVFHTSFLRHSYIIQMLKLAAISSVPQCKDCSYLALHGGDRLYKKTTNENEAQRHVDAIIRYIDAATEAAKKAGATRVEFVILRGVQIISTKRLERDLSLQGVSAEEFNLNYQSEIIARAAMARPEVTLIDTTECLQASQQIDSLHYQYDGHFTPIGVETFMSCLSRPSKPLWNAEP